MQDATPYLEIMVTEVEEQLASGVERDSDVERQARREADQKIVALVREDLTAGREERFKRLAGRLIGYGLPILGKWVRSREIFGKVNALRDQANRTLAQRGARTMPLIRSNEMTGRRGLRTISIR